MLLEDIVYVLILLLSTWFGQYYRKIKDPFAKQWASTLYGLFVVITVSGIHVAHPIVCTLVNAVIITQLSWKYVHMVAKIVNHVTELRKNRVARVTALK